jgi:hypothetical protein
MAGRPIALEWRKLIQKNGMKYWST